MYVQDRPLYVLVVETGIGFDMMLRERRCDESLRLLLTVSTSAAQPAHSSRCLERLTFLSSLPRPIPHFLLVPWHLYSNHPPPHPPVVFLPCFRVCVAAMRRPFSRLLLCYFCFRRHRSIGWTGFCCKHSTRLPLPLLLQRNPYPPHVGNSWR